jgi:M6 family metalloprotease-like protein
MLRRPQLTLTLALCLVSAVLVSSAGLVSLAGVQQPSGDAWPPPIDPQQWQDQDDMTWDDYRPIPRANWGDVALAPERPIRVALVAIDFEDQPFVVTLPRQSDPFGNPQVEPVARADVARFYADFWGTPNAFNHGHTIHEYWMEQSRGQVGIPRIDPYGPYRMPRPLFEYGLNEWDQEGGCPGGHTCDGRMEPDADALWRADAGEDIRDKYDVVLRIYAGYDETTVWQEFGEMRFASRDDIPAEWGNPDPAMPRWVTTRYVPWTSWLAGAQQWGLSSVRQGESSGTITHELGHLVFRVGDNNNNPYVTPYRRVGTGPWDMMDRGSFNGPGGPHRRWVVPAAEGASMPAGLMLRNRLAMEILPADQVLRLSREALAASGPAVVRVNARAVEPGGSLWNEWAGVIVRLDGEEPRDRTPPCDRDADPLCAGDPVFDDYSIEVVQRIGYDSFTPDNGVLIAKNKDRQTNSCGYGCHAWVIDPHPEDIDMVDFVRPGSGERVMRTIADYRQLNDALFHAGLRSGSEYEFVDEPNRVHVYVIDRHVDLTGVLSYSVGVRSLEAAGPQARGVVVEAPPAAIRVRPRRRSRATSTGCPCRSRAPAGRRPSGTRSSPSL